MKMFLGYFCAISAALLLGFFAVSGFVKKPLSNAPPPSALNLTLQLRGTGNKPIPNAKITIYTPQEKILGHTDSRGMFAGIFKVPQGKSVILQAEGPQFLARKNLLIPRSAYYKTSVLMDPDQVRMGQMSLISKSQEEKLKSEPVLRKKINSRQDNF